MLFNVFFFKPQSTIWEKQNSLRQFQLVLSLDAYCDNLIGQMTKDENNFNTDTENILRAMFW